jgi:Cys-tRNA(Pro)/Cys-tRNA(Cys) deacylase
MAQLTTRITAFLDEQGIPYRVLPHSEPVFTVEAAGAQRGVRQEEMVKSILLRDKQRRYVVACVKGVDQLDPKAVRNVLPEEWKRLSFASRDEILEVTGYLQGAIAPLCLPEDVPIVFDMAIGTLEQVNISSGDPMAGLELRPGDLIRLAKAMLAPIAKGSGADIVR